MNDFRTRGRMVSWRTRMYNMVMLVYVCIPVLYSSFWREGLLVI